METESSVLQAILDRNKRVEEDKAWETSKARRAAVAALTYGTSSLFLWSIGNNNPLFHAIFPPLGYILSTLSLPWIKRQWSRHYRTPR